MMRNLFFWMLLVFGVLSVLPAAAEFTDSQAAEMLEFTREIRSFTKDNRDLLESVVASSGTTEQRLDGVQGVQWVQIGLLCIIVGVLVWRPDS